MLVVLVAELEKALDEIQPPALESVNFQNLKKNKQKKKKLDGD